MTTQTLTKPLCDWCHKRPATYTAYREIGFGVEVKVAGVCNACRRKALGK